MGKPWHDIHDSTEPRSVKYSIPRHIILRIGFLLAALLAIQLGILACLSLIERRAVREIFADEREEHGRLLDGILRMEGKPLQMFVEDYARRALPAGSDDTGPATLSMLAAGVRTHEIAAAWLLEADGTVRIQSDAVEASPQSPPLTPLQIARLPSENAHFYLARAGAVYEVRGLRLAAGASRPGAPRGWLFAATRWDIPRLQTTVLPLDARVTIIQPAQAGLSPPSEMTVRIERALTDFAGQPAAVIRLDCEPPEILVLGTTNRAGLFWVGAFGVIAVGICGVCLWRWIVVPASVLRRSLAIHDPGLLQPLVEAGGDMEILAELMRDLMDTRHQLERTLVEHARLSRDLHDGVIQTIYAAGMNVAGARSLIASNPTLAAERLDRSCAALNNAVLDVRSVIHGLEPEALGKRLFRLNVESIYSLLRPIRPVELQTKIDDAVCARFTPEQTMHAMQIIREALANSFRHSNATAVTVRVQAWADGSVIEVEDNGSGYEPARVKGGGRGLKNMATRAAEIGGTIAIEAIEPKGTRVRLTIPLPHVS